MKENYENYNIYEIARRLSRATSVNSELTKIITFYLADQKYQSAEELLLAYQKANSEFSSQA